MDHDADQHDDRAIALALAATKLLDRQVGNGTASVGWDAVPVQGLVGTASRATTQVLADYSVKPFTPTKNTGHGSSTVST